MTTPPIETQITPPEPDIEEDGDDVPSARLGVYWISPGDTHFDAGVQLFGEHGSDPERFAAGLLGAALALAALVGPDHSWAAVQRLAAYDGTPPR